MSIFRRIKEDFEKRAREMYKRDMAAIRADELLNELCEQLRHIGVSGTVHVAERAEAMGEMLVGGVVGYVTIEGRNIDLVQVESVSHGGPSHDLGMDSGVYFHPVFMVLYYHYVVRTNVEGLEDKLNAEVKPIMKGFLNRKVVDFRWEGGELAQRLNADSELRNMLLREGLDKLPNIEVKPHEKPRQVPGIGKPPQDFLEAQASFKQCVRITKRPKIPSDSEAHEMFEVRRVPVPERKVGVESPTREDFEVYDRIAQHVRSIVSA